MSSWVIKYIDILLSHLWPLKNSSHDILRPPSLDDSTIDMAKSTSTESLLTGLKKYTEYNITVLAYTGGGDGPRSRSAICQTEEDGT